MFEVSEKAQEMIRKALESREEKSLSGWCIPEAGELVLHWECLWMGLRKKIRFSRKMASHS